MRKTSLVPPARLAWHLACLLPLLAAPAIPAAARELCVHCTGPTVSYRCTSPSAGQGAALQLACITEIARKGRHEACAVSTSAVACPGAVLHVALPDRDDGEGGEHTGAAPGDRPPAVAASPPSAGPASPRPTTEPAPAAPPPRNPDHPLEKVGESINKAGERVGDTARRSWSCVASLFKSC